MWFTSRALDTFATETRTTIVYVLFYARYWEGHGAEFQVVLTVFLEGKMD